jgi:2-amino-4-hydroxy-6-hydroxymethyldihydropteridine diphosphokinase
VAAHRWTPAYVGLGSNLDDPPLRIERGLDALARLPDTRLVLRSQLYRSKPFGPIAQPDFVNAAAGLLTRLPCRALLDALKDAETRLGRERPVVHWGSRRIDLDLLVYGTVQIAEQDLIVPHPELAKRAFVLVPLAEFAPDLRVPGLGLVRDLLAALDTSELTRLPA